MLKKILSALVAVSALLAAWPALAAATAPTISAATATCVGNAVSAREAAITAAFVAFAPAQSTALTTRHSALQAAWAWAPTNLNKVRTAVAAAWKAYRAAHWVAVKAHNKAVATAWTKFRAAVKVCKITKPIPVDGQNASDNSLAQ